MAEEAMPVVSLGERVPGPVRHFGVEKDDARAAIWGVGIAPDVPIALGIGARTARLPEPGMLIRSVVQHELDNDPQVALMCRVEKDLEIVQAPIALVHRIVIRDVV